MLKLSPKNEKRMFSNIRELSMVEGNILGAGRANRTLYVTSCFNGEGKTHSAIALAYALTLSGSARVLLIDGNSRAPKVHDLFHTERSPGFREFLLSESDQNAAVRETGYTNLYVMPLGSGTLHGFDRNGKNRFPETMELLTREFDYIVFDGNSIYDASDSALISKNFDGIVLTVECEKTKWDVVGQTVEKIRQFNGNVLGVVLNKRRYYLPGFVYKLL